MDATTPTPVIAGTIVGRWLLMAALCLSIPAQAADTLPLPEWLCSTPDAIFISDLDGAQNTVPHNASLGSGGVLAGNTLRSVHVPGYGDRDVFAHVPDGYSPNRPMPLLIVLHGTSGSPSAAEAAAATLRDQWGTLPLYGREYIVIVPVAGGAHGSWVPPAFDGSGPSDYDVIAAAIADAENAWNIELTREYAWGFSAGGDILHDLMLNGWAGIDANRLAGYAVIGAALSVCPDYVTAPTCEPANAARHIPLDIHLGTSDPIASPPYDGDGDAAIFSAAGWVHEENLFETRYAGGHNYALAQLAGAWTNLCNKAVVP